MKIIGYLNFQLYIYNILLTLTFGLVPRKEPASLSLKSIRDSVLPAIQPIAAASSTVFREFLEVFSKNPLPGFSERRKRIFGISRDLGGSLKNFFGLTYDQMQSKNLSLDDTINIDLVTKNGNVKYDLKTNRKLTRMVNRAERIVVITHGFMESSEGEMVQGLSAELLKHTRWKIFALDGRKSINLEYLRSSTYARFMGELLGTFLSQLVKGGQDPANVTIIGHSLGAHIAGIAGKQVFNLTGKRIGRITGLDPAGPCFLNVTLKERLDASDADYVDVVHTNAGVFGLKQPVGHKDFYPNGGSTQSGCFFYSCDHSRAWEFYIESLTAPKAFPAHKCENYTLFEDGKCNKTEMVYMGVDSIQGSPGLYFLNTNSSKPFGIPL